MRFLASFTAAVIVASLAFGQTTTSPTKPKPESGAKPKIVVAAEAKPETQKPARPKRDIREMINSRVPEVRFEQTALEKVMEWVQEYTGVMVYVRYGVLEEYGIDRETPVTVKARDTKLAKILWVVMNEAAGSTGVTLAYQASADLIVFSTHEDLSGKMVTRVYEVKNIIADIPDFADDGTFEGREGRVWRARVRRPPRSEPLGDALTSDSQPPPREIKSEEEALQEFMEFILNSVEPESWAINGMGGQGTIFPYKGKLAIRNSLHVHQILAGEREP